jgi:sugar lactone lactonase YvrE
MKIDLSEVQTIGQGILRPEGVMALDDGSLYASDGRGQIASIQRDGRTTFFGRLAGTPNGICLDGQGRCIVANIGNGQVQALHPNGHHEILLTEAEGMKITTPNFPFVDSKGRLWVTNSTARQDVNEALQQPSADGSVILLEKGKARIVAERIYFANGLALDPEETHLYVAETMLRRVLRFKILPDGSLSHREMYGPSTLAPLGFPDGIAFDEAGNLWITFPAWNAVGYLTPRRELQVVLEDPERKVLQRPSNICFGWEERKTAFIGSLDGTTIPYFQVPHPGARLIHQK